MKSSGNEIYLNNLDDNTNNIDSDGSDNSWFSPEPIKYTYNGEEYTSELGNYYDNYNGNDDNKDGIGETTHTIDNNNEDKNPLVEPVKNYKTSKKEKGLPLMWISLGIMIIGLIGGTIYIRKNKT